MTLLLLLVACSAPNRPAPLPPDRAGAPFAFARQSGTIAELELPMSSRPDGEPSPEQVPINGPFKRVRTVGGVATWESAIPIRPRNLFFQSAPPGMSVEDAAGKRLSFADGLKGSKRQRSWDFTAETLQLRLADAAGPPERDAWFLRYDRAQQREDQLNLSTAGLTRGDFVCRSLQLGEDTRTGLYLPAPGRVGWDVAVPPSAVLSLDATVLPPELDEGLRSDGARLIVEVSPAGSEGAGEPAGSVDLSVGDWAKVRLDLSRWAGQTVRLRFRTDPGESALLDYVFLSDPILYSPTTAPRRLVLVFIDTLRVDHLGLYGYERDTTPRIDTWSQGAAVFTHARAVAPWTLPSTRALLSSRQPESWRDGPILPELLAQQGWATAAFVGNVYLSANFEMSEGWGLHSAVNWPIAQVQVDKARAFLESNPDRDAAVLLHVMDMHLPYTEPLSYRFRWASKLPPEGLEPGFMSGNVAQAVRKQGQQDAAKQYVTDRYDQNLRYLDDQLMDLIDSLGPLATVALFSDHGEELWDHGGFEHGHTLYEELLRVPLVIKGPGVPARRVEAPVSLMDLAPTLAELLDLDPQGMRGTSLIPAASGDGAAIDALEASPLAFGRPLYGNPRWGVLAGDLKWTSHEGVERVINLAAHPDERGRSRGADLPALRAAFSEAIGQPAPVVWRVYPGKHSGAPARDLVVEFHHPAGFTTAWLGDDPLLRSSMDIDHEDGSETVAVTFHKGAYGTREIYLDPAGPPEDFADLSITIRDGQTAVTRRAGDSGEAGALPDGQLHTLLRASGGGRSFTVTYGVAPVPPEEGLQLVGVDPEQEDALKNLGYYQK